jgi:hypothetical protein
MERMRNNMKISRDALDKIWEIQREFIKIMKKHDPGNNEMELCAMKDKNQCKQPEEMLYMQIHFPKMGLGEYEVSVLPYKDDEGETDFDIIASESFRESNDMHRLNMIKENLNNDKIVLSLRDELEKDEDILSYVTIYDYCTKEEYIEKSQEFFKELKLLIEKY